MEFGQILEGLLQEKGIKAAKLARYLGTNQTTVSGWLRDGRSPSFEYILPICDFFRVSPYYLLSGSGPRQVESPLTEEQKRLLQYYDLLTDFERGELTAELRIKTAGRTAPAQPRT